MSVFEVGRTLSESTGGHASAGGNSGAGNRFYFSDDAHAELGLQRGNSYDVRIRLKGNTSGFIKLTMIGHRGYAPNAGGNRPFCYIVEALPQQMGTRTALSSTVSGVATKSFEDGIEAQHLMGLNAGDFYPTVSCFQYTDYTEITLRVMNKSVTLESSQNRSNVKDTTAADHSAALTKHYAGQSDNTVAGQSGEMGGDAIFFTAYIEGYSYNSTLSEGIFTSYNKFFGGRGMSSGGIGVSPSPTADMDHIQYLTIGVLGSNITDFGELTQARAYAYSVSDGSRYITAAGLSSAPAARDTIDYVSFATAADAKDFGELQNARFHMESGAGSDGSRAIFCGSTQPDKTTIDHLTIGIPMNGLDFGELTSGRHGMAGHENGSRFLTGSGYTSTGTNIIEFNVVGVLGNSIDFGDSTSSRWHNVGCSDGSRGVAMGGETPGGTTEVMDYVNIGTTGNALDFGEMTSAVKYTHAYSDGSRGIRGTGSGGSQRVDYFTISTLGAAVEFGEQETNQATAVTGRAGD
jgi:hypothetical protein